MNTKRLLSTSMLLIVATALLLTACAPVVPAVEPTPATADPIMIVQSYYDAVNAGEFDKMAALMAEDIVMTWPGGRYSGKPEVIQANQDSFDAGMRFEISDLKNTDGRVTSCFKVFQKEALIDQGCTGVTIVRRGQILFDGLAKDEPEYVVRRYYEALNAKDLELAMSFVAGDAVFINPTGTYEGAEAIRESLKGLSQDEVIFKLSNFFGLAGRVSYDYKVMQSENLLDQGSNGLTIVKDGLIIFDGTEDTEPNASGQVDPAAIAQSFYQATNEGDLEVAMALVAEDVKCRGGCYITGKQSFRAWIQGSINRGGYIEIRDLKVEEDTVSYNWEAFSEDGFFQARGVETLQIKDGLIVLMESIAQ